MTKRSLKYRMKKETALTTVPKSISVILVLVYLMVNKQHMKFVVSFALNASQGSHSAAPMGGGKGNVAQGPHAVASCSVW